VTALPPPDGLGLRRTAAAVMLLDDRSWDAEAWTKRLGRTPFTVRIIASRQLTELVPKDPT
jgi:hypothetical protein